MMLNLQSLMIEHFVKALKDAYQQTYSLMEPQNANILEWTGRLAWKISPTQTHSTTM